jgi:hypothetical protein
MVLDPMARQARSWLRAAVCRAAGAGEEALGGVRRSGNGRHLRQGVTMAAGRQEVMA